MSKPNRVRYSDVAVFCDAPGRILSRVQSFTADTDKSVEEMRELSNENITEYVEGLPVVSISIDTSEFGSLKNLNYLCGQKAADKYVNRSNFDTSSVDLFAQIEEDGALARTMYMGDCFITGISWSFDVGGVASENFTLESDNKVQYFDTKKEMFVASGYYDGATTASGILTYVDSGWGPLHTGLFISKDNEIIRSAADKTILVPDLSAGAAGMHAAIYDGNKVDTAIPIISGGSRYRVGFYKTTPNTTIQTGHGWLDSSSIGGVRKGMVEIYLVPSGGKLVPSGSTHEIYRLQTVSVDVDLSREALEELGNYKAYYRSMVLPIPVTVTLSALESDVDNWCRLANGTKDTWPTALTSAGEISFRDFVKGASVHVKIYTDDESAASRNALKSVVVRNLTATAESFSIDVGGNATQDITCNADNFLVSGY